MKELLEFIEYLNDLYERNDVCVFYELSGHVDWFEYKICESKKDYTHDLISGKIHLKDNYYDGTSLKDIIEQVKEKIEYAIIRRKETVEQLKLKEIEREKEMLRKLKEKYPDSCKESGVEKKDDIPF